MLSAAPPIHLPHRALMEMIGHAYDERPNEACGLLVGPVVGGPVVTRFAQCENVATSSSLYEIGPKDLLRIDEQAADDELEVVGVMHSHTQTEPYPSPTDVAQAAHLDSRWHFVIVSLSQEMPRTRSYRIVGDEIVEEQITAM